MIMSKGFHLKGLGYIDNISYLWYLLHAGWGGGDSVVWQSEAAQKTSNTMFKCQRTSLNGKFFFWPCSQKSLNRDGCWHVWIKASLGVTIVSHWITFIHVCMLCREQNLWLGRKAMSLYWHIFKGHKRSRKLEMSFSWFREQCACI